MKKLAICLVAVFVLSMAASASAGEQIPAWEIYTTSLAVGPEQCLFSLELLDGREYKAEGTWMLSVSSNEPENVTFQCHGALTDISPTGPPDSAIKAYSGGVWVFSCYNGDGFVKTEKWSLKIAPSGKAFFNCQSNPSSSFY